MPLYDFINKDTGEEFERLMSIAAKEEYLEQNPHITQKVSAPNFVYNTKSLDQRTDNGWKEVLSKISEKHPSSALADRYGPKKTIAQVKTQEIRQKHKKKKEKQ
jgi:hypothetical protein